MRLSNHFVVLWAAATLSAAAVAGPTVGDNVSVKDFRWHLGGFGKVLVLDSLVVDNRNTFKIRDILVECSTSGPSGTQLSRVQMMIYEVLPAKKSKVFKAINMGIVHPQSATANCSIVGGTPTN